MSMGDLFDEVRLRQMVQFGFTELQAKVYIANYVLGEASAKQIKDFCKMHKAEVYRVLNELQSAGLVDQIISYPVRYRTRCPEEVLKSLLLPTIRRMAALSDMKSELLEWFGTLRSTNNGCEDDRGFEVLHDRLAVERAIEMFHRASGYIYYTTRYEDKTKSGLMDAFNRAIERGVSAKGIVSIIERDTEGLKRLKWSHRISKRHSDRVYSWSIIVDGKEAIFGSAPTVRPGEQFLYTKNQRYIAHLIRKFELLYEKAAPLEILTEEASLPCLPQSTKEKYL